MIKKQTTDAIADWVMTIYKDKFWGVFAKILVISLVFTIVHFIAEIFSTNTDSFLKIVIKLIVAVMAYMIFEIKTLRKDNENSNNSLENKIYRKLISTNAIINNRDNKLSITARILDDFPDESTYKNNPPSKYHSVSIDLVRILSYQNLLLTPKYLDYFFFRKESVKEATRIIVVDRDHLDGRICQATLTYIYLSARYDYITHIITEKKFKEFVAKKCLNIEMLKMIKGNPFMIKTAKDNEQIIYDGEYINYQNNIEDNGLNVDIKGAEYWGKLNELLKYSERVRAKSTGFSEYVKSLAATNNKKKIN